MEHKSEFLHSIFGLLENQVILAIDPDGQILPLNSNIEQLTGHSLTELVNKPLIDLYESINDKNQFTNVLTEAKASRKSQQNVKWLRKNAPPFMVNLKLQAVWKHNELQGFAVLAKDLTEENKHQKYLRESEAKHHLLAADTMGIVWTRNVDGEFIDQQPTWQQYTGQIPDEYLHFGWLNAHHEDERKELLKSWQEAKKSGNYERLSRIWSNEKKEFRWVVVHGIGIYDTDGNLQGWIGTDTDIHDLKIAQEELKRAHEKLSHTLNSVHIGTWVWEISENKIACDEHTVNLLGLKPEQVIISFQGFLGVVHPDDRKQLEETLHNILQSEKEHKFECTYRVEHSDGKTHYLEGRGLIIRNERNEALCMQGFCWDITNIKQLEKERIEAINREKTSAETYQQQLIEYIDTLCHELRNSLNGIYSAVELMSISFKNLDDLLQNMVDTDDKQKIRQCIINLRDLLDTLAKCSESQKALVDDVLDFSKLISGEVTIIQVKFNPKKILTDVSKMFTPQLICKHLTIEHELPEENFTVIGDPTRLTQVITNLCVNAIKFTHEGNIKISLGYQLLEQDKIKLIFSVSDTGIGMTQKEKDSLFKGFRQANPMIAHQYGGTGLGLSIAKKLVELMGGEINVQSEKDQGSTFTFFIQAEHPVFGMQEEVLTTPVKQEPIVSANTKRILIVEDNLINQKILSNYLVHMGYSCDIANNGQEAVEKYKNGNYDIIFMDVEMPVMNGLVATGEIRKLESKSELAKKSFIIGLSGNARPEQKGLAIAAGMDTYLTKPYHKEDLSRAIALSEETAEPDQKIRKTSSAQALTPYSKAAFVTQPGSTPLVKTEIKIEDKQFCDMVKDAESIIIVGDFNNWLNSQNGKIEPKGNEEDVWKMTRNNNGTWSLSVALPAGRYSYKYLIDKEYWLPPGKLPNLDFEVKNPSIEAKTTECMQMQSD